MLRTGQHSYKNTIYKNYQNFVKMDAIQQKQWKCSSCCRPTQQDYYGRRCGTLLHSYCAGTYTEVTMLLIWSNSNATLEYPRRYSNRVAVWALHGNSRVTSQELRSYFSVGTTAVTV